MRYTNPSTVPIVLRFGEWRAKRDIPASMANTPVGGNPQLSHPINQMRNFISNTSVNPFPREAAGEADSGGDSTWGVDYTADYVEFNYDVNRMQNFPLIRYWFAFKFTKEIRLEPGASTDYTYAFTPKMQLHRAMFYNAFYGMQYPTITNWNGTDVRFGTTIWKGLNDRGPYVEWKGVVGQVPTSQGGLGALYQTEHGLIEESRFTVKMNLPPFKTTSHYATQSNTIDPQLNAQHIEEGIYMVNKPAAYIQFPHQAYQRDLKPTTQDASSDTLN